MADKSIKRVNEEAIHVTHAAAFSLDEEMEYEQEEEGEEDEASEEGAEGELGEQEEEVEEEEEVKEVDEIEEEEEKDGEKCEDSIDSHIYTPEPAVLLAGKIEFTWDTDEEDLEEVTLVDSPKSPKSPLSTRSDESEEEEDGEKCEDSIDSHIYAPEPAVLLAGKIEFTWDTDEDDLEEVTLVDSPKSPKSPLSTRSDESSSYSDMETEEENQQQPKEEEAGCKVKINANQILKTVDQCTSEHKTCPGIDECPLYKFKMETDSNQSSSEEDEPAVAPVPVVPAVPVVPVVQVVPPPDVPKPVLHFVPVPQEHLETHVISKEEMLETPLYDLTLEQFFRLQNYWI